MLYNGELGDFVLVTEYYQGDPTKVNGRMEHVGVREINSFSKKTERSEITWETQDGWKEE